MRSWISAGVLALGLWVMAAPATAGVMLVVRHDVADYSAWRKAYDGFRDTQRKLGVTKQSVYQSVDNANDVTVLHGFRSEAAVKSFLASEKLKSAMQGGGVKGEPQIWVTVTTAGASGHPGKVRLYVHHEVADYAAWRKGYDGFAPALHKAGVSAQGVLRTTANPNDVIVYHDFATTEAAKSFAASPELKTAMQNAGVKGQPQVWITTLAAK